MSAKFCVARQMLRPDSAKMIDLWREQNWYAIHAKPHRENFAAANLAALEVEIFFPRLKQETSVRGLTQTIIRPLFSGYFFARFCPAFTLESVRYARGVLRVLSSGNFPIPVHEEIIHAIRDRIFGDGYFRFAPQLWNSGDAVMIQDGPLEGLVGSFERECSDGKRVTILLDAIQQARVSIEKRRLKLASA
jgi:transcriptional antiterminator RfaH